MSTDPSQVEKSAKRVFIETLGCQMNKADSENMFGLLGEIGYEQTLDEKNADLLVLNTCAIREGAEEKVYSYLGVWGKRKRKQPNLMIAVGGCVAQDKGESLLTRIPYVDVVFGTHNLHRLPDLVLQAQQEKRQVAELFQELPEDLPELPVIRQSDLSAWVSIIYGCDYNCTYCIVPYVRGREKSRTPEVIEKECLELAASGYLEVTLLGQNVTAYGHDLNPVIHLGDLIRRVGKIDQLKRIRFMTGHPRDLQDGIIDAINEVENACEHFHIPIQAGNDRTLKRMARGYQVDFYKRLIEKIRNKMPDASITSDLIVGFPGETEAEFLDTVRLVEDVAFDACNTAAYSPRPHTHSASWEGQVPEPEKFERLRYLNAVIGEVSNRINKRYLGRKVEVLVEGLSQRDASRVMGRTRTNKIVNFDGDISLKGKLVDVEILSANTWALRGSLCATARATANVT